MGPRAGQKVFTLQTVAAKGEAEAQRRGAGWWVLAARGRVDQARPAREARAAVSLRGPGAASAGSARRHRRSGWSRRSPEISVTRGCRGCRGPRRGRTRVTRVGRFQVRSAIRDRGYPATLRGDGAVSLHACPCASSRPGKTPACSTPPPPRVSATGRPGTLSHGSRTETARFSCLQGCLVQRVGATLASSRPRPQGRLKVLFAPAFDHCIR